MNQQVRRAGATESFIAYPIAEVPTGRPYHLSNTGMWLCDRMLRTLKSPATKWLGMNVTLRLRGMLLDRPPWRTTYRILLGMFETALSPGQRVEIILHLYSAVEFVQVFVTVFRYTKA
jgi:hypothetical protein